MTGAHSTGEQIRATMALLFSNSLGPDQTIRMWHLIWIQAVCHILVQTPVRSICIFYVFRMAEIILIGINGVFKPLCTNAFFLLVWYDNLGIEHCACPGLSGSRCNLICMKTFFVLTFCMDPLKCCIMRHFIWVLTVCICGRLEVSCKQRVKSGSVPFLMISLDQDIEFRMFLFQIRLN